MAKLDNNPVNHPFHYTEGFSPVNIECIDITRHLPFSLGNAFKYVWRAGKKGGPEKAIEDLEKAIWYLEDAEKWKPEDSWKPCTNSAVAVFSLIKPPDEIGMEGLRYSILDWIIKQQYFEATSYIENFKYRFRKLKAQNENH